jgi:hypothetical protein
VSQVRASSTTVTMFGLLRAACGYPKALACDRTYSVVGDEGGMGADDEGGDATAAGAAASSATTGAAAATADGTTTVTTAAGTATTASTAIAGVASASATTSASTSTTATTTTTTTATTATTNNTTTTPVASTPAAIMLIAEDVGASSEVAVMGSVLDIRDHPALPAQPAHSHSMQLDADNTSIAPTLPMASQAERDELAGEHAVCDELLRSRWCNAGLFVEAITSARARTRITAREGLLALALLQVRVVCCVYVVL